MKPEVLPPNVLRHFYAGGPRIAALRGVELDSDHMPEEWLGAVSTTFGSDERGLSRLQDGTLVRDAIAADPEALARRRARPSVRPRPRLPRQAAGRRPAPARALPSRPRVRARGAGPPAREDRGVGHRRGRARGRGARRVLATGGARRAARLDADPGHRGDARRDARAPPRCRRRRPRPGRAAACDRAGILLVELQEPTDLSVLLEWDGFELSEDDGHLDLGWDGALAALDRTAWDGARLAGLRAAPAVAARAADPYFRAERLAGGSSLDPGFSVLVGIAGSGTLATDGGELPFARGSVVLVPYASGEGDSGRRQALRRRPPDPAAGEGEW